MFYVQCSTLDVLFSVLWGSVVLASMGRHKAGPYTFSANRLLLSNTDDRLPLTFSLSYLLIFRPLSSVLCLPSSVFRPLGRRPTDTRQGVR